MSRSSAFRSDKPGYTKSSIKFPQGTMVWEHHVEECQQLELDFCVFLQTNVTATIYQEVLEHFLLPTAEQLFGGDEFTFQHDLAPSHDAKFTKTKTISGLPRIRYRSCLARQTLRISILSNYRKFLENREEENGCLSIDYFGAVKGIHHASLEPHYICQLPMVGGIHVETSSGRDSCKWRS